MGGDAVMEDAPDIAQHDIELTRENTQLRDDRRHDVIGGGQKGLRTG
jgi:hypothetical protein